MLNGVMLSAVAPHSRQRPIFILKMFFKRKQSLKYNFCFFIASEVAEQGDQQISKKNLPNFSKNSPKSCQVKKAKISTTKLNLKAQSIYNKPSFETAYLGENLLNLLTQKVAQKVAIILGYFILSKNHNEPPKVAQLVKNRPIWSP